MATKTEVILIDDLTDGRADETVEFALDGVTYEIDLDFVNSKELRAVYARYIAAGRKLGRSTTSTTRSIRSARSVRTGGSASPRRRKPSGGVSQSTEKKAQNRKIREWAQLQGIEAPALGRIPDYVLEAYFDKHRDEERVQY